MKRLRFGTALSWITGRLKNKRKIVWRRKVLELGSAGPNELTHGLHPFSQWLSEAYSITSSDSMCCTKALRLLFNKANPPAKEMSTHHEINYRCFLKNDCLY